MAQSRYCVSDVGLHRTSWITGRDIIVSEHYDRVVIPEEIEAMTVSRVAEAIGCYWDNWVARHRQADYKWKGIDIRRYQAIRTVRDRADLVAAIDEMLELRKGARQPRGEARRCLVTLTQLWGHGLASVPPNLTHEGRINCEVCAETVGERLEWLLEIASVMSLKSEGETT